MTTATTVDSSLAFQRLETQKTTFQSAAFMPAAVSSGSFEELVKPTPVSTAAHTASPAPDVKGDVPAEVKDEVKAEAAPAQEPEQEAASIGDSKPLLYETGIASTYGMGDGFEGMRTGCGGVFHTRVIQVAHKSLPCGTLVRVQDTDTGRYVDAEVTDRGPYVAGRIVDLSYAAFTQLDETGTGLLHVNVYILDTSNQYLYKLRG